MWPAERMARSLGTFTPNRCAHRSSSETIQWLHRSTPLFSIIFGFKIAEHEIVRLNLWTGPLKVHLGLLISLLLIGVAVPLIWVAYDRGRMAAVGAAQEKMRLLTDRIVDRYQMVFGSA